MKLLLINNLIVSLEGINYDIIVCQGSPGHVYALESMNKIQSGGIQNKISHLKSEEL